MRDAVIGEIFEAAKSNPDIVFMSADLGAQALDAFREELPGQFISAGIAEQNMIDVASGLALSGKTVFCYAMAPFITARCYEQTRCATGLPITLIGVGVGLGYDHATLTHFAVDDIAIMRALNGIEILTPSDEESSRAMAVDLIANPRFRYLRLERQPLKPIYNGRFSLERGYGEFGDGKNVAVIASGYMTHKAMEACDGLEDLGVDVTVIDLFRVKPFPVLDLRRFKAVLTVEEHILDGGMGSAVLETFRDIGPFRFISIKNGFEVINGDRDELHAAYRIGVSDIRAAIIDLA